MSLSTARRRLLGFLLRSLSGLPRRLPEQRSGLLEQLVLRNMPCYRRRRMDMISWWIIEIPTGPRMSDRQLGRDAAFSMRSTPFPKVRQLNWSKAHLDHKGGLPCFEAQLL